MAYAGLETGVRDRTSYVLKQIKIRIIIDYAPLTQDSPIHEHLRKERSKSGGSLVKDATSAYEEKQ
jgi:4-hydroxyphenylpyruvate dioxygenase